MSAGERFKEFVLTSGSTPAVFIQDLEDVTIQFQGISGDSIDIEISNAHGLDSAIQAADWDPAGTAIGADDTHGITEGPRWVRFTKTSGANPVTIRLSGTIKLG